MLVLIIGAQLIAACLLVLEVGTLIEAVATGRVAYRAMSAAFLAFGQVRLHANCHAVVLTMCLAPRRLLR